MTPPKSMTQRLCLVVLLVLLSCVSAALNEEDRLVEYRKRNYKWPLPDDSYVPNTPGWRHILRHRFDQIERIEDSNERYNAWLAFITSAVVAKNYTENGWGLARAPAHLVEELKQSLHKGLPTAKTEHFINVIEGDGDARPLFIPQHTLNRKVLDELKPMHEEWSGVPLTGSIAYGLRAYRNNSNLLMHVDKSETHIISCILHVDHSDDSEDWPIIIEDYQGNTNEVVLESGDMLFYESSKCFHGRPRRFQGSWYSSLFVHYHPTGWDKKKASLETHYAVPPHWNVQSPPEEGLDNLIMVGTSFKEPDCKDNLCSLEHSVLWKGPAPEGAVVTTGWDPNTLTPPTTDEDRTEGDTMDEL